MQNKKAILVVVTLFVCSCLNLWASTQLSKNHSVEIKNISRLADPPTLSAKSSETIDNTDIFVYNSSYMDANVVKVFYEVKELHKQGTLVTFELFPFEVDELSKTVKVGVKKGTLSQKDLMDYLQRKLNNVFSPSN